MHTATGEVCDWDFRDAYQVRIRNTPCNAEAFAHPDRVAAWEEDKGVDMGPEQVTPVIGDCKAQQGGSKFASHTTEEGEVKAQDRFVLFASAGTQHSCAPAGRGSAGCETSAASAFAPASRNGGLPGSAGRKRARQSHVQMQMSATMEGRQNKQFSPSP